MIRATSLANRLRQSEDGRVHLENLQNWALRQPDPERTQLLRHLEADEDEVVFSAELELFVGQVLHEQGLVFERHPRLGSSDRRPDFRVHRPDDEASFILEARASVDLRVVRRNHVMRSLRDRLDSVVGRQLVHLVVDGQLTGHHSVNQIGNAIEKTVAQILEDDEEAHVAYDEEGCRITVEVLAWQDEEGPILGGWQFGSVAHDVDTGPALKQAVEKKAGRYGELGCPFVVAVYAQRSMHLTRHSVLQALYGTPQWQFSDVPGEELRFLGERYSADGVFTARGPTGPLRTRLSAVALYEARNRNGEGMTYELAVLHNPFPQFPLDPSYFRGRPQFMLSDTDHLKWDSPPSWWD